MKELSDDIANEITYMVQGVNNDILEVIGNRIRVIGETTPTDAHRLAIMTRNTDLAEIERHLQEISNKTPEEVKSVIEEASKHNDDLAESLYKANGVKQSIRIFSIVGLEYIQQIADDVLNLSSTLGFNIDGKYKSIRQAYLDAINKAVYSVQNGFVDYQSSMRSTVRNLSRSGIQTVDFASGYSRRLDSQVRMNILDGVRQFNQDYRKEQGQEFGADGVEISAHALCAADHIPVQGKQYTNAEFERLQETLERPIGTMNCKHTTFPIILGISEPTYTDKELKDIDKNSNEVVNFNGLSGKPIQKTRYEATQYQRSLETSIRELKDERNMMKASGFDTKSINRDIRERTNEYYRISDEIGLKPQKTRLVSWVNK